MPLRFIRHFIQMESFSGILLFSAAMLALILNNSPAAYWYQSIITKHLLFWVNEVGMSLFFFLIGLELKREFLEGELANKSKIALPSIAAFGGMLVPACIYLLISYHHPETAKGWAIPVATDIAFALGILSLLGNRVPLGLKLFLMALTIFDDVGAIIIITVFYTSHLSYLALSLAVVAMIILWGLHYFKIPHLSIYLFIGILLWFCILKSGIHATLTGVLLALMIPIHNGDKNISHTLRLEKILHPWVAFLVMPLFAFANAGFSFAGLGWNTLTDTVFLGVLLGLVLGKQIGVLSFTWIAVRLNFARLPANTSWLEIYGVALLCGIGFTMSLFLGTLAFSQDNSVYLIEVRLGVLIGSILSGSLGATVLNRVFSNNEREKQI